MLRQPGRKGLPDQGFPGGKARAFIRDFVADGGKSAEEELADVSHSDGVAVRDAVLGDEQEEFAQEVIDIAGSLEFAGKGNEFLADLFYRKELGYFVSFAGGEAGVEEAERDVTLPARHAALAAVGGGELAAIGVRLLGSYGGTAGLVFHRDLISGVTAKRSTADEMTGRRTQELEAVPAVRSSPVYVLCDTAPISSG